MHEQDQQQRWTQLATTLRRTSARVVDLFVRVPLAFERNSDSAVRREWNVWLEVACARRARVSSRVDLWLEHDVLVSKVQSVSAWLHEHEDGVDNETLLGDLAAASGYRALLTHKRHGSVASPDNAGIDDALTRALQQIAHDVVTLFHASHVQTMLASSNQLATFEFELLRRHTGLDVLVTTCDNAPRVTFTLPLGAADTPAYDAHAVCSTAADATHTLFVPDAFNRPTTINHDDEHHDEATRNPALSIVYALDSDARQPLAIAVHWPACLELSSRIVHVPMPSQRLSSIETLSACEQSFAVQWNQRKAFIRELRQRVIVLEYDAVDFARVFFMAQEQRDARAPLQIVLLALTFPPEYFLTLCPSDLQLSLLDGDSDDTSSSSVAMQLQPLPRVFEATDSLSSASAASLVCSFLAAVHDALVRHGDAAVGS